MEQTMHIFGKEFRAYFASPIAYIVISIFLIVSGWFFFSTFFLYGQAELRGFFSLLPYTCSFLVPAVTMRLFAEEFNTGSFELLLTLPVSRRDIVLGKFFAATAFTAVMLLPTLCYVVTVALLGDLDWGPVLGGYAGALLLCAAFSAIGVLASSLTRNQIVSFIVALTACLVLTLLDKLLVFAPERLVGLFQFLGADAHFESIARGILDTRDVLYFLSVCFVALSGTTLVIRERS
jgi:gliding motility-associated transport system permease protein